MKLTDAVARFYAISAPAPRRADAGTPQGQRAYRRLAMQSFVAATLGYSLYYVCRTSLNVMKKPIVDSGLLDNAQLGIIGSALLFAYAAGKFINGFVCDYCNIKRFMATGLCVSLAVNFALGATGFVAASTAGVSSTAVFLLFAVLWCVNGWAQSMGAPPAIISLSRWLPLARRGTFYGFFSASHNLGEFFSFLFVGLIVGAAGWMWGFVGSAAAGAVGVAIVVAWLHDTPESKGLPPIEQLAGERPAARDGSTRQLQREVLRMPAVWIIAASSAFMYVSRYAVNGWGVLYLQEQKGMSLETATSIISVNALLGVLGTVLSGWFSDALFGGDRRKPALIFGVLNSVALALFLYGGNAVWVNVLAMVLFGIAIGVLICFVGGLMAVDLVPRRVTGAALGVVGMASYIAAGVQDVVSGQLIDKHIEILADGTRHYDFTAAAAFWLAASVVSFVLPLLNWNRRRPDEAEDSYRQSENG